jgi:superfamily II DNA helicase RecQ
VTNKEEGIMVEHGAFSIVYGTPEAWLKNERGRDMLRNSVYSEKLYAIAIDEAHVLNKNTLQLKYIIVNTSVLI